MHLAFGDPSLHGHSMENSLRFPKENLPESRRRRKEVSGCGGGCLVEDEDGGGLEDDLERSLRSTSRIAGAWGWKNRV